MVKVLTLIFLFGTVCVQIESACDPCVTTPLGKLKGTTLSTVLGKTIYAFRGIRYAKPPVNELRFQPPVPVERWEYTYDATKDAPRCPQPSDDLISEDCLFLNVYTTKLPTGNKNPKRPVIVFFHAGGWYSVSSSSNIYGPQYFLDQEIVLVTTNYRLGSLGFLSTGTREAPGNNGMKDQVLALKWVQNNIASFGGDPNSVTIAGYSAGGASVYAHMLSPLSKGLFHKGIAMSGSILGPLPIRTDQLNLAKRQARLLNCPDDTAAKILDCLKNKTATELGNSLAGFSEFGNDPIWKWTPVIEPDFGQPRFLTDHPVKLVLKGKFEKVPLLTGVNTHEFGYRAFAVTENETYLEEFDRDYERIWPIALCYERDTNNSKRVSEGLRTFYFGDGNIDKTSFDNISKIYADGVIGFSVNRAAKIISENNDKPVYYYKFSYGGRYSHFYLPNTTIPYGTVHHDELIYLFYISVLFPEFNATDPEFQTVDRLTSMWANFAKTGNPIPETSGKFDDVKWEPFEMNTQKYMDIGKKLALREKLYENRYSTWEKLFPLSQFQN